MATINASLRGLQRGITLPLLLDLARKPVFLHDNSVPSIDNLLDPARGATAPHAFYLSAAGQRSDMVTFLNSLTTSSATTMSRLLSYHPGKQQKNDDRALTTAAALHPMPRTQPLTQK
jgi:hypothetical protein